MGRKASSSVKVQLDVPSYHHQVLSVEALAKGETVGQYVMRLISRDVDVWSAANNGKTNTPLLDGVKASS